MQASRLLTSYLSHLEESLRSIEREDGLTIQAAWLTPEHDPIEIDVACLDGEKIGLSDRGKALGYLFLVGMDLTPGRRKMRLAKEIVDSFGATLKDGEVTIMCSPSDFGRALDSMIQAVAGVYSLVYTVKVLPEIEARRSLGPRVSSLLRRELRPWREYLHRGRVIRGATDWFIDYAYTLHLVRELQVLVPTVDLDVKEPVQKAEHLVTLCYDVRRVLGESVRTMAVYRAPEGNGKVKDARQAEELIKELSDNKRTYEYYDLRREADELKSRVRSDLATLTQNLPLFKA